MDANRIARIARRICATFDSRWDQEKQELVPAGVMDVAKNGQRVFLSESFKREWNRLFTKFSRNSPDARESINDYYRRSLQLIKSGMIGKDSSGIEIKLIKDVKNARGASYYECKQAHIKGTGFHPRIYFAKVPHTSDSILLEVIDKDGTDIPTAIMNSLTNAYTAALQNDYQNTYSQN